MAWSKYVLTLAITDYVCWSPLFKLRRSENVQSRWGYAAGQFIKPDGVAMQALMGHCHFKGGNQRIISSKAHKQVNMSMFWKGAWDLDLYISLDMTSHVQAHLLFVAYSHSYIECLSRGSGGFLST